MNSDKKHKDDRSDGLWSQESLDDELLSAYVDGELTGSELARVESHLRQDAEARRWAAELRTLSSLLQSLPRGRPTPDLREQVLRRVNERRLSIEAKQPVRLTPSLAGESHGSLRPWLWSGMAIAAVLLLMFLQPGQPDAERRVADVQSGAVQSGAIQSGPVRNEPAKDRREEKDKSERMSRVVAHDREAGSDSLATLPAAAGRSDRAASMGRSSEGKLAAEPVPSVASARVPEELLALGVKSSRENSFERFGLSRKTNDRSLAQAGVGGRSESMHAARPTRSKQAASRRAEPDLVVPMFLHDPRRDGPWFRQLLTEHGMKPRKESDSSQMTDALSEETEEEGLRWQTARGRPRVTYPGELMETVTVEALPEQLRGLLKACRTDPERHVTVGRMPSDGASLSGRSTRDAPGETGADDKNQHDKRRADLRWQLRIPGDAVDTTQGPLRVRFELRVTKPDEESGEAPDAPNPEP